MLKFLIMFSVFIVSTIAIGEDTPWWASTTKEGLSGFPEINMWLIAVLTFVSGLLRISSELLGFISKKTASKKDDMIYKKLSDWSLWAGKILGWFGAGVPKQIEKAKEAKK